MATMIIGQLEVVRDAIVRGGICLALRAPKELRRLHAVARSGQESIAQGLPWEISPTLISPEGASN
jgi:hypothetical protein